MGHESVVSLLLAHNAKPDPKNNTGQILILLEAEKRQGAIVRMLIVGWTQTPRITSAKHCCRGERLVAMKG